MFEVSNEFGRDVVFEFGLFAALLIFLDILLLMCRRIFLQAHGCLIVGISVDKEEGVTDTAYHFTRLRVFIEVLLASHALRLDNGEVSSFCGRLRFYNDGLDRSASLLHIPLRSSRW